MGDKSQVKLYTELLSFLEANGKSIEPFGSAERGLGITSTYQFLDLLEQNNVRLLGIEHWRSSGDGYSLDHSGIWYEESTIRDHFLDARQFLGRASKGIDDVFTVQFG